MKDHTTQWSQQNGCLNTAGGLDSTQAVSNMRSQRPGHELIASAEHYHDFAINTEIAGSTPSNSSSAVDDTGNISTALQIPEIGHLHSVDHPRIQNSVPAIAYLPAALPANDQMYTYSPLYPHVAAGASGITSPTSSAASYSTLPAPITVQGRLSGLTESPAGKSKQPELTNLEDEDEDDFPDDEGNDLGDEDEDEDQEEDDTQRFDLQNQDLADEDEAENSGDKDSDDNGQQKVNPIEDDPEDNDSEDDSEPDVPSSSRKGGRGHVPMFRGRPTVGGLRIPGYGSR